MEFISILSIFVMACFVGYYVVWSVTPALHTPLMAVANAISSVIIVGGLIAADSSALFGRNLFNFLNVFADKEAGRPVLDEEIGDTIRLTKDGKVVHERLLD